MIFRYTLSLFLLSVVSTTATAQVVTNNNPVLVQVFGYIIQSDSTITVPYASVYNPKNKMIALADGNGFFSMVMANTDTLEISCIGYEKKKFSLPKDYSMPTYSARVTMKRIIINLPNAYVGVINWEQFKQEFQNMPLVDHRNLIVGDPNVLARSYTEYKQNFGYTFKGPFTALYNKFSRKAKEMDKLQDLLNQDNIRTAANSNLTTELIQEVTGLTPQDVDEFVQFCSIDTEFAARSSKYDLMVAVSKCYDYYKKSKPYLDKKQEIYNNGNPPDDGN